MITYDINQFEGADFALQIMSKGSFIDTGRSDRGPDKAFAVEATTIRLNWVALNEFIETKTFNCRDVYEDGPAGDEQWKARLAECEASTKVFEGKIKAALGIAPDKGVFIQQVHSEVFTVCNIWEVLTKKSRSGERNV